jgi:hypothetical protein
MSRILGRSGRRRWLLLSIMLLAGCQMSCQIDPQVSVNDQNPPTFHLSGPGNLYYFSLNEIGSEDQLASLRPDSPGGPTLWKVIPNPDTSNRIADLPNIRYGDIPNGFRQTVPENAPPPALREGVVYSAGGPTYDADSGAAVWFVIRGGKSVEVSPRH